MAIHDVIFDVARKARGPVTDQSLKNDRMEKERQTNTDRQRQRDRQRERDRETETETETGAQRD